MFVRTRSLSWTHNPPATVQGNDLQLGSVFPHLQPFLAEETPPHTRETEMRNRTGSSQLMHGSNRTVKPRRYVTYHKEWRFDVATRINVRDMSSSSHLT